MSRRDIAMGFKESAQLAKDADLDGLRDHSGFQLLMIDLAFPADSFAGP